MYEKFLYVTKIIKRSVVNVLNFLNNNVDFDV